MFFVRYRESGLPHIRVRLACASSDCIATEAFVESHVSRYQAKPDDTSEPAAGTGAVPHRLVWEPATYVPELQRYGGVEAIIVAEDVFDATSTYALAKLEHPISSRSVRLSTALVGMCVTLAAFCESIHLAATVAQAYGLAMVRAFAAASGKPAAGIHATIDSQRPHRADSDDALLRRAWRERARWLAETSYEATLYAALKRSATELRSMVEKRTVAFYGGVRATSWEDCLKIVLPSYLHMTSNRLGVAMAEEAYLAYTLANAWGVRAQELV